MERLLNAAFAAVLTVSASAAATAQTSKAPTNQSAEEIVIKEKLSVAGVRDLKDLTRNRDGTWHAIGVKDNNEVAVVVDTDGAVRFH